MQAVGAERLSISGNPPVMTFEAFSSLNRVVRTKLGAGRTVVDYRAEIDVALREYDPGAVRECSFADLPPETLVYLLPSRFCPSDLFCDIARREFGDAPRGFQRAQAIADWVHGQLAYGAGSSGPHTTAADAFQQRNGVCRDFAHLAISLCRASGIPARYVSAYAHALSPQDFHAVMEVYLLGPDGGAWFTLDPTHMSSPDAMARIAAGRDAADVAFAWTQESIEAETSANCGHRAGSQPRSQVDAGCGRRLICFCTTDTNRRGACA